MVNGTTDQLSRPWSNSSPVGPLAPVPIWFTRDGDAVVVGTTPRDYYDYTQERPRGIARVPLDGSAPLQVAFGDEWAFLSIVKAEAV